MGVCHSSVHVRTFLHTTACVAFMHNDGRMMKVRDCLRCGVRISISASSRLLKPPEKSRDYSGTELEVEFAVSLLDSI